MPSSRARMMPITSLREPSSRSVRPTVWRSPTDGSQSL